jgi:hypothetical protein
MPDVAGKIPFPPMKEAVHKLNQERPVSTETQMAKVMEKRAMKKATDI